MPQTIVTYEKICIIDQKVFLSKRISTVYCSQKCRNKARSFPTKLLEQLIAKHALATIIHEGPPKSVRDYITKNDLCLTPISESHSDIKPDQTMSHVIPTSVQQDLINQAKRELTSRKIKMGTGDDEIEFDVPKDDN